MKLEQPKHLEQNFQTCSQFFEAMHKHPLNSLLFDRVNQYWQRRRRIVVFKDLAGRKNLAFDFDVRERIFQFNGQVVIFESY